MTPIVAGVVYCLLAVLTIELTHASRGIATVWPPNAVLLALLLRREPPKWAPILIAGFIGNAAANFITRDAITAPMLFSLANMVEVVVAARGLRWQTETSAILKSPASVWRFMLWAGVIAPAVAGLFGAQTTVLLYGAAFLPSFLTWFVADGLGLLTVTPFLMALLRGDYVRGFREQTWTQRLEAAALLALAAAVTTFVFHNQTYPLLFLVSLPLMLVTFRLGWLGAKLAIILVAVIGATSTLTHSGPIAVLVPDPQFQVFFFQFYLAALLMLNMPVAAALAKSDELMRKLQDSDRSFRLLASQSPTLLAQFDRDGICRKALGSSEILPAESRAAIVGSGFDAISASGKPVLETAHSRALAERDTLHAVEFRAQDGSDRWFEATFCAMLDERGHCTGTLASIHNVTERKHHATALAHSAMTDSLTGVLNRAGFMHRLDAALAHGPAGALAIAMIDVDRFKLINDNSGHLAGDSVLREIATRISRQIRAQDAVGRLGGDEFAILIDASDGIDVNEICNRIVAAIGSAAIALPGGGALRTAISCGVGMYEPGQSADDLLHAADGALYAAKRGGRNSVVAA
ncbi:MAG: diguanylate cyclase [Sphingobium sp.]